MIRFLTAGESHGKAILAIADGFPSGIPFGYEQLNKELKRRHFSVGRGGRAAIETDEAEILSGIRNGKSIGSPITISIKNKDWENWKDKMSEQLFPAQHQKLTKPRPGHADLAGVIKTGQDDIRNILERASARETAARVAVGAIAKIMLKILGIEIGSHVISIGEVKSEKTEIESVAQLETLDNNPTRCLDEGASKKIEAEVEKAAKDGDSLGGIFEVIIFGLPIGLGNYSQWDEKLDAKLAMAITSIPAIKGVEFGDGFELSHKRGSETADEIFYEKDKGYFRTSNHMGGIEGGMSNGQIVNIKAVMKPIPTIKKGLNTVDIQSKQPAKAFYERSDVCAVPRAAVVAEAMVAITIASAINQKFGADSLEELQRNYNSYVNSIK
jgi:chorismate synthase